MTSRQPKSEEGVLQPPRRTPFVYLVHENSMNMPTAIQHPRIAAIGCVARAWAGVPLTLAVAPVLSALGPAAPGSAVRPSMAAARRDVAGGTRLAQVSAGAYIYARAPPKQQALAQKAPASSLRSQPARPTGASSAPTFRQRTDVRGLRAHTRLGHMLLRPRDNNSNSSVRARQQCK